jgi:BirA family transcriptional regulator, biotin operon repressor / biotin---[acetyl-CoA-carboxylase] ligase
MAFDPAPFDLTRVRDRLPERQIHWFASVNSTMTLAVQLARDGCASGTVVGADGQVAGIGRHGHAWHSEAKAGLYVSIVLRLPIAANALPVLMLALGVATARAIEDVAGLTADLRWPNDVLIDDNYVAKKCAGILAQLEGEAVVAGIGINVNHTVFPGEIASMATSLRLASTRGVPREDLLVALLEEIDACCKILTTEGAPAILQLFTRHSSYAQGRRVRVERDGAIIEGTTRGVDASGFLVVREDNGKETTILAGGVRPV